MKMTTVSKALTAVLLFSLAYQVAAQPGLERKIENSVDKKVDKQVEKQVARGLEKNIDKQVAKAAEKQVDRQVGQSVSSQVSAQVDDSVADKAANKGKALGKTGELPEQALAGKANSQGKGHGVTDALAANGAAGNDTSAEYSVFDEDPSGRYLRNQRLLMLDHKQLARLQAKGITFRSSTSLKTLNKTLVSVDADVADALAEESRVRAERNYVYRYQSAAEGGDWQPADALQLQVPVERQKKLRLGLVDSKVKTDHSSLRRANFESRSFVAPGLTLPEHHGTAVASVMAGDDGEYLGLLPAARYYSAAVFYRTSDGGDTASLESILLALDWMAQQRVDVVNISLAGPANPLLQQMVKAVAKAGVIMVAAAGNEGPGAAPAYPAAYEDVVAVTAIDRRDQVYYRATHGRYIDLAAPGVGVLTANSEGGYKGATGTSYASPFAAAAIAGELTVRRGKAVRYLLDSAVDLGEPGFDAVYGYGRLEVPDHGSLAVE